MGKYTTKKFVFTFGLLAALLVLTLPVCAVNGTINIAYRGAGGNYLGDTIIFDGYNTFSNVTLLKITGPGLPAEGVPVYDINGAIGSGNIVPVNADGYWKFVWYTGSVKGVEKLQTARYYITAFDRAYPENTFVTSLVLKKSEFYVAAFPSTALAGDYVQLTGISETGTSGVHFDIADPAGKIVHSYDTTVSASGYFNKAFHVDLLPGVYTVTMSSPTVKSVYRTSLTILAASPGVNASTAVPAQAGSSTQVPPVTAGTGSVSLSSSPAGATVFLDAVPMGTTPIELNTITAGNHIIEIKAPGYVTTTVQITVKPGDAITMSPTLLRNSPTVPLSVLTVIAGLLISCAVVIACAKRRRT